MTDGSPLEAIEAVRRARGLPPGPPGDRVLPNEHMVSGESPVPGPSRPAASTTSMVPGLGLPAAGVKDQGDGVSLTRGEGWFEGHLLKLTLEELDALRSLLAGVALRQMNDERDRLSTMVAAKRKEAKR